MNMMYLVRNKKHFLNSLIILLRDQGRVIFTTKAKSNLQNIESIHNHICKKLSIQSHSIQNHVDSFCTENAQRILQRFLSAEQFEINSYIFHSTLIADNMDDLLDYIFSTPRYQIPIAQYKQEWRNFLKSHRLFVDIHKESVFIVKKL